MKVCPLAKKTIENMFSNWKSVLSLREIGFVLWLPRTDQIYRSQQFIDWMKKNSPELQIKTVDIVSNYIEDAQQLETELHGVDCVVLTSAQRLFDADMHEALHWLLKFQKKQNIPLYLHCEHSPGVLDSHLLTQSNLMLQQHVFHQPLYEKEDIFQFVSYLEDKWNLTLDQEIKEKIWEYCGGYLWLVKEVVRQITTHRDKSLNTIELIFHSDALNWKKQQIWNNFSNQIQRMMIAIVCDQEAGEVELLHRYKLIQYGQLPYFLIEHIRSMQTEIVFRDAHFFLNNLDVTSNFSKKERHILQKFLTNKNKILSREEVASAYWGDAAHEEYSDWAIDQLISRLRKKMSRAGSFSTTIQAVRGRGYLYA